jgi:hypothetical protein
MLNEAWNNAFFVEILLDNGFHTLSLMNFTYPSTIWGKSSASYANALMKNSVSAFIWNTVCLLWKVRKLRKGNASKVWSLILKSILKLDILINYNLWMKKKMDLILFCLCALSWQSPSRKDTTFEEIVFIFFLMN